MRRDPMVVENKIDIEIYKVVTRAMAESDNMEIMASQLTQLLVGTLEIKGSTIFVFNPETEELETMASFGLSVNYLNKGPVLVKKSLDHNVMKEPVVIRDVKESNRLQYPEDAKKEGIRAIVSLPITLSGKFVGVLRLYHFETWDISEQDLDTLSLLGENIGLVMMYTRLLNALRSVKEIMNEVHPIWIEQK